MEIIIAIIIGAAAGAFIGFALARGKDKGLQSTIDKLQWQLESEKANAAQSALNHQKQLADAKADAKELTESVKADCEKRIAQVKSDAEKQPPLTLTSISNVFSVLVATKGCFKSITFVS